MSYTARQSQIREMLDLQIKMNAMVNPDWINARYPFLLAAMVEANEAICHYSFKWWKKETPNLQQVQLEIVDMIHFMLSDQLVDANQLSRWDTPFSEVIDAVVYLLDDLIENSQASDETILYQLKNLVAMSSQDYNAFPDVIRLLPHIDMDWDKLYRLYVAKNALNTLRQNYGYKQGTYIKIWDGREDNEHLYDIVNSLEPGTTNAYNVIYERLDERYHQELTTQYNGKK